MTTITIQNPWSRVYVDRDITGVTDAELAPYAALMDDEIREEIITSFQATTPEQFLAAYVMRVGPEEAGRILFS